MDKRRTSRDVHTPESFTPITFLLTFKFQWTTFHLLGIYIEAVYIPKGAICHELKETNFPSLFPLAEPNRRRTSRLSFAYHLVNQRIVSAGT